MFPEAWHVMFVRDLADGRDRGAFIRIEPSDERPYASPFFELLPDSTLSRNRSAETVVRWQNYRTRDQVVPVDETHRERLAPAARPGVLARLGDLRKRVATPRLAVSPPNGNAHKAPVQRAPDAVAVNRQSTTTEQQRAPVVSPPAAPVVPTRIPTPVTDSQPAAAPRDIRNSASPAPKTTGSPPPAAATPRAASFDPVVPGKAPPRNSPLALVGTS